MPAWSLPGINHFGQLSYNEYYRVHGKPSADDYHLSIDVVTFGGFASSGACTLQELADSLPDIEADPKEVLRWLQVALTQDRVKSDKNAEFVEYLEVDASEASHLNGMLMRLPPDNGRGEGYMEKGSKRSEGCIEDFLLALFDEYKSLRSQVQNQATRAAKKRPYSSPQAAPAPALPHPAGRTSQAATQAETPTRGFLEQPSWPASTDPLLDSLAGPAALPAANGSHSGTHVAEDQATQGAQGPGGGPEHSWPPSQTAAHGAAGQPKVVAGPASGRAVSRGGRRAKGPGFTRPHFK